MSTEDRRAPRRTEEEILRRRAELAAVSRDEMRDPDIRLLVFRAAGELFATDLKAVSAITIIRAMTPLPGVPRALAGLLNVRGRHVTAIDLGLFLPGRATTQRKIVDAAKAITVFHGNRDVALISEEVLGIREAFVADLTAISAAGADDPVKALGPEKSLVLDVPALFRDPRLAARTQRGI